MVTIKQEAYSPIGAFSFPEDEWRTGASWVRMIAGPDREPMKRDATGRIQRSQFTATDLIILELLAKYRGLTVGMLGLLLSAFGQTCSRDTVEMSLARLAKYRAVNCYRLAWRDGSASAPVYSLASPGAKILIDCVSPGTYMCEDLQEPCARIEADMTAGRILLSFLSSGMVKGDVVVRGPSVDRRALEQEAIVRPTGACMLDDQPVWLEVVRRGYEWQEQFCRKARRYALVAAHEPVPPLLIVCAEDAEHSREIEGLLDTAGAGLCPVYIDAADTGDSGLLDRMYCYVAGKKRRIAFGLKKTA